MTKKIILLLLVITFSIIYSCKNKDRKINAEIVVKEKKIKKDSIACSEIHVGSLSIGFSQEKVESILGKPDSITKDTDEENDCTDDLLHYTANQLSFSKGHLFGFTLNDSKFDFNCISVGDSIRKITIKYPNYINDYGSTIRFNCKDACKICKGCLSPEFVHFDYNEKNIITKIHADWQRE